MTFASLVMLLEMVMENTNARITMTIYRNARIMDISLPISSPAKIIA